MSSFNAHKKAFIVFDAATDTCFDCCKISNSNFKFQLKYKRRVYKMLDLDEKQLKSINSKTSLKKFVDHVAANNVEKVKKMCAKGLDPNFHCAETGGKNFFRTRKINLCLQ